MTFIAGWIAGVGVLSVLWRRTTLGVLVGFQLLFLATTLFWALFGKANGQLEKAQAYGVILVAASVLPVLLGLALSVRLFYLRKSNSVDEISTLRH